MEIKKNLFEACNQFCENSLNNITGNLQEIKEALTTETKSSAGDKHETGRAMLQLEREKLGNQLAEIQKVQQVLFKINIEKRHTKITLGSLIYTTQSNYFIAISAGELVVNNQKFYAISGNTPMGQLLLGKTIGDDVVFREQRFKIETII